MTGGSRRSAASPCVSPGSDARSPAVFAQASSHNLRLMPTDLCVRRVGGEKILLLSAAAWGSMTAFTPVLAHFCSQPIFSMTLSRFLMGLLQGDAKGF